MQRLEFSGAVRPIYVSLDVRRLTPEPIFPNFFLWEEFVGFLERHVYIILNSEGIVLKHTGC